MSDISLARRARRAWKRWRFVRSGQRPWSRGYEEHKEAQIVQALHDTKLDVGALPPGYGFRLDERIVEYPWLFSRLPSGPGTLLDAGSVLNFAWLIDHPKVRDKRLHICTLAPESQCFWRRGVSYVFDDLRRLPYRDGWFDWVVCVSTIEHIGMDNTQLYTADAERRENRPEDGLIAMRELRRVLKPGGTLFLTAPYGRAANHGWLQVFDGRGIEMLTAAFAPSSSKASYYRYDAKGWHSSNAAETADATYFDVHHAPKPDPDFAAAARAVCCLELRA
jgi:SAM-dependent methyltransferase